jgi:hypothetical protein
MQVDKAVTPDSGPLTTTIAVFQAIGSFSRLAVCTNDLEEYALS